MHKFIVYPTILMVLMINSAFAHVDQNKTARALLIAFTEAVISGSQEVLGSMLAPEYQIMRTNGVGFNRKDYLERGIASLSFKPNYRHEDLHVTENGGVMVVRYYLNINETIDGVAIEKRAPRLTVFRRIDGKWKVVAHSNFATAR